MNLLSFADAEGQSSRLTRKLISKWIGLLLIITLIYFLFTSKHDQTTITPDSPTTTPVSKSVEATAIYTNPLPPHAGLFKWNMKPKPPLLPLPPLQLLPPLPLDSVLREPLEASESVRAEDIVDYTVATSSLQDQPIQICKRTMLYQFGRTSFHSLFVKLRPTADLSEMQDCMGLDRNLPFWFVLRQSPNTFPTLCYSIHLAGTTVLSKLTSFHQLYPVGHLP